MSNLYDVIGMAHFINGANYSLASDRFNNTDSAIYLNHGYLQAPNGSYFSNEFTVIAWINFKSYRDHARIFDFGNTEITFLAMNQENIYASYFDQQNEYTTQIQLNKWYHIAFVKLNESFGLIYVNGRQSFFKNSNYSSSIAVFNNLNFIGKSNADGEPMVDAIYDDFKIFRVALTSDDIMSDYKYSSCSEGKKCSIIFR